MIVTFLSLAFLFFNGFLIYTYKKYGITKSISATFDKLEREGKQWTFQTSQFGFCAFIFIAATIALANDYIGWQAMFIPLAAMAITFSSLAADTEEDELVMRNHVYGATGGIIFAAIFMATSGWISFCLAAIGGLVTFYMDEKEVKNRTYWIEWMWFHLFLIDLILETYLL
jgi:hypothetical protein